ncbi:MAG: MFS transporter [Candidatus Hydrogenedentota bacterium]
MADSTQTPARMPGNVWVVSATSFLTDVSSEMVFNLLPLFLANVLGAKTVTIGLVEGVAESTASLVKLASGYYSDMWRSRKWPSVAGYGISAIAKVFFLFATNWWIVAAVRWADRVGKGVRTAPRDALIADSIDIRQRGRAFGIHRAADSAGAVAGLLIAAAVIGLVSGGTAALDATAFQSVVLVSLVPALLAVVVLAAFAKETVNARTPNSTNPSFKSLGRPFWAFLLAAAVFGLGNSSDAFLILRVQERGLGIIGILVLLSGFNVVNSIVSLYAGALSDRIGRFKVLACGWLAYAAIYAGFALSGSTAATCALFLIYGVYHGLTDGVTRAFLADLVNPELRGSAYGVYHGVIGIIHLPASLLAGLFWGGWGEWDGFGAAAPFLFGSAMALAATGLLFAMRIAYKPHMQPS